jgi:hypothetical protein
MSLNGGATRGKKGSRTVKSSRRKEMELENRRREM